LVLSVGGAKGIAHIGAIDAIKEKGIKIDCVYGNSMGSVIGSLFASEPNENLKRRYTMLIAEYINVTKSEKKAGFLAGFLTGLGMSILSGGVLGWETMLGSLTVGTINSTFYSELDNDRFRRVLNLVLKKINIEQTKIPFATSYQMKEGEGLKMLIASKGNLAEAVSRSSNNPFIFEKTNFQYIDPGSDRLASIPIEEACLHFKPTHIIAINVTGNKSVYQKGLDCNIKEIYIEMKDPPKESIKGVGEEFEKVYKVGYETVIKEL
jgi:NTE family protein